MSVWMSVGYSVSLEGLARARRGTACILEPYRPYTVDTFFRRAYTPGPDRKNTEETGHPVESGEHPGGPQGGT